MATNSLAGLRQTMYATAAQLPNNVNRVMGEVADAIAPVLVYATPVDTSRARANWQASIGSPATGVLFSKPQSPPTPSAGGNIAISSIRGVAALYAGQPGGIYIVNNLDYIQRLNDGYSGQAPANFVELAVVAAIRSMRNVRIIP